MASGMVSLIPMVSGEGPRDPSPTPAVRNSKLPTLSARAIVAGDTRPARICSDRLEGGRGMAIELLGVGICRWSLLMLAADAGADEMSPTSEKMSPRSAYRLELQREEVGGAQSENFDRLTWNYSSATASDSVAERKDVPWSACWR